MEGESCWNSYASTVKKKEEGTESVCLYCVRDACVCVCLCVRIQIERCFAESVDHDFTDATDWIVSFHRIVCEYGVSRTLHALELVSWRVNGHDKLDSKRALKGSENGLANPVLRD